MSTVAATQLNLPGATLWQLQNAFTGSAWQTGALGFTNAAAPAPGRLATVGQQLGVLGYGPGPAGSVPGWTYTQSGQLVPSSQVQGLAAPVSINLLA